MGRFTLVALLCVAACKVPNAHRSDVDASLAESCGDGVLNGGENCDDGNTIDGDGCSASCLSDESCGNGIVDESVEEACDDGNSVGGDGCSSDCKSDETCGNGVRDEIKGESCDDGNSVPNDGCGRNCQVNEDCGNGQLNPGEQCDSGNHYKAKSNENFSTP
jgi:cysteine-rich repeat protein